MKLTIEDLVRERNAKAVRRLVAARNEEARGARRQRRQPSPLDMILTFKISLRVVVSLWDAVKLRLMGKEAAAKLMHAIQRKIERA